MDIKNISKLKTVYQISCSSDGKLHIERRPVIYANKEFVYIKKGSANRLTCLSTAYIKDNLKDFLGSISRCETISDSQMMIGGYYWSTGVVDEKDTVRQVKVNLKRIVEQSRLNDAKKNLERAQRELDSAKMKYAKAEKELGKMIEVG